MTDALDKIREAIRGEADGTTFPMPVEDARALIAEHERLTERLAVHQKLGLAAIFLADTFDEGSDPDSEMSKIRDEWVEAKIAERLTAPRPAEPEMIAQIRRIINDRKYGNDPEWVALNVRGALANGGFWTKWLTAPSTETEVEALRKVIDDASDRWTLLDGNHAHRSRESRDECMQGHCDGDTTLNGYGFTSATPAPTRVEFTADAIFAAGFRRQGPVTDAGVDAACESYRSFGDDYPGELQDVMRAALEAAREVIA